MGNVATKKNKGLYIVDERAPVLLSWLRDGFSFGSLAATAWFVNTQMPPSGWVNFMVCALWLLWMIGKGQRHKVEMTAQEAREWLDENYPQGMENSHDRT